jgi:hypothetical protein
MRTRIKKLCDELGLCTRCFGYWMQTDEQCRRCPMYSGYHASDEPKPKIAISDMNSKARKLYRQRLVLWQLVRKKVGIQINGG